MQTVDDPRAEHAGRHIRDEGVSPGINLDTLGLRKPAKEKVLLAAVLKAATEVSNGWLCERLGMGTPAGVSQFVRRFCKQAGRTGKNSERLCLALRHDPFVGVLVRAADITARRILRP